MDCCQCRGIERFFGRKIAASELGSYRKKGPTATTRLLLGAIRAEGVEGASLLDIGGGIGAVQHELAAAGVGAVTSVDASPAYLSAAQGEAERQGYADRVTYRHGDFVALASDVATADIVTLDRVVCCYHDMRALVRLSSERAGRLYGLVYPRDRWWMKAARAVMNVSFWTVRHPFRFFVHATADVDALARASGLAPRFTGKTLLWQVVVYGR
jgi:magnesium-protoporphyrin O-methyltransferase